MSTPTMTNRDAIEKALCLLPGHDRGSVAAWVARTIADILDEQNGNEVHRDVEGILQDLKRDRAIRRTAVPVKTEVKP